MESINSVRELEFQAAAKSQPDESLGSKVAEKQMTLWGVNDTQPQLRLVPLSHSSKCPMIMGYYCFHF